MAGSLGDEKYMLLTTFRRDGTPVPTPVWSVPMDGDRVAFYTSSTSGKAKRLAHTTRVTVQPCTARNKPLEGSTVTEATAQVVTGPELETIRSKVHAKYSVMSKITPVLAKIGGFFKRKRQPYADRGVIITPDGSATPTA